MVRAAQFVGAIALMGAAAGGAAAQTALPLAEAPEVDLLGLVTKAHPVVQGVMASLVAASFLVLTVMIYKLVEFPMVRRHLRQSRRALADGLAAPTGTCPLAQAAKVAEAELSGLPAGVTPALRASVRERLDLSLARIEAGAVQRLRAGTGLLASIGSVGPFVGLFGTVFGIMNSFLAIAATKTTNLAVVAPGIAEALLATGLGLVAAIPAVLLYNHVMRGIRAYRHRLVDGMAEVQRQVSRALDGRMVA